MEDGLNRFHVSFDDSAIKAEFKDQSYVVDRQSGNVLAICTNTNAALEIAAALETKMKLKGVLGL